MSRWQQRNLSDAFRLRRSEALQNKRVLLIDDVLTSGATARAITQLLLDKGAAAVDILTATRVLPYGPSPVIVEGSGAKVMTGFTKALVAALINEDLHDRNV